MDTTDSQFMANTYNNVIKALNILKQLKMQK